MKLNTLKIKALPLNSIDRLLILLQLLFWIIIGVKIYLSFGALIKTVKLINNLGLEYVQISIVDDKVSYEQTKERTQKWKNINEISKRIAAAVVVSEDGKFYNHKGFDIEQILKVVDLKLRYKHKKVRGASTITQQLVKNLYLSKEKSLDRKMKELYFSTLIEDKMSKDKILETYLNIIEYGKNIYGIENASQYYFKKSAKYLTAKESAFIAMLLPSPVRYSKSFKIKALTPYALSTINNILLKMRQAGYISEVEYVNSLNERLSFEKSTPEISSDEMQVSEELSADELGDESRVE
jgi:monofunctional biosynthetic peptidoglycan transglycosylase